MVNFSKKVPIGPGQALNGYHVF